MITPIRDIVLCKPFPSDEISEGGIIVSDAHKAVSQKMEVIAVGKGLKNKPMNLKPGDTAFRVKDNGTEVWENGQQYFLLKSDWLIAKLN